MGYMAPSIIFINVNGRSDLTAFVISIPPYIKKNLGNILYLYFICNWI